jgi:hypothetical protein
MLPDISQICRDAADAMPEPKALVCQECGDRLNIGRAMAANYLQEGWPKCCGYTMRLVTVNDEPEGGVGPMTKRLKKTKPCPFCGGTNIVLLIDTQEDDFCGCDDCTLFVCGQTPKQARDSWEAPRAYEPKQVAVKHTCKVTT